MTTAIPRPELLSPAGGPAALRAAVNNGADAVYLGVDRLNARRGAENFTIETLAEATRFAHLKGVKVYLTANVVVLPEEMDEALELIDAAWTAGIDAVIVQDIGLMRSIATLMPHVRIHASTQVGTHNAATVEQLVGWGVSRVTLARETSLAEMSALSAATEVELEAFIHGALCMSYSGQCLLSSLIGRRSANRGLCAQPCRMTYDLLDDRGQDLKTPGPYLLSPKDLCTLDSLGTFVRSGVASLKIEGRMKDPEYVALVTGVYRAALDRAVTDPDGYQALESEHAIVSEAFSRGFSPAYAEDIRDNQMMSYTRPNNRGVAIGRVQAVEGRSVSVLLDTALEAEDTIEVWTSKGRFAQKVGPMRFDGRSVNTGAAGMVVSFKAERNASRGDRVFRVANSALENAARRTFADARGRRPLQLDIAVRLVEGQPLRIELSYGEFTAAADGPIVEAARTKSVTAEEVVEHVGRLGDTLFEPRAWDIELQPGVGIGFSLLHKVRRRAVEALEARMLSPWAGRSAVHPRSEAPARRAREARPVAPEIVVWTDSVVTARSCLAAGARRAIMPVWAVREIPADELPDGVTVELPRIAHEREVADLVAEASDGRDVVVGNLGMVEPAAKQGAEVQTHWSLNAVNQWSCAALADAGASLVWLSPELSGRQTTRIAEETSVPLGLAVYGRQEVMVTEHCVLMSMGECGQVCGTCSRRTSWHGLRDRKGYTFPVKTDPMGRSHIFNSVPLDLTRAAAEIVAAGVSAVRLDFTVERSQQAQKITRIVREAFAAAVGDREIEEVAAENATTGHFFRGVY